MIRIVAVLALVGILFCVPSNGKAQDPIGAMMWELGLSQAQIDQVRQLFQAFARKQQAIPTPVDVLMQNRPALREVLTTAPFDRAKAEEIARKGAMVIEQRMVNRLELRNQIFQVLTQQQREKYVRMVEENLAGLQ
jgi:Spy/CpxP family protein refolding chaperone